MIHLCILEYSKTKGQHIFPLLFSFVLSCACAVNVYVCSQVCMHVYVCLCVYASEADIGCLLSQISTLCVGVGGLQMNLELPSSCLSALLREFLFLPQRCWDNKQSSCLPGFCVHFGTQTPVFMLA